MKAVVFHGTEELELAALADPVVEADDDAIVRVRAAGLCGSDLHPYFGRERGLDPGTVMGHELVGEVVETGPDVSRFNPGDRVAAPFSTCCAACGACRRDLPSRCDRGQLFGWVENGVGLQGVQAEFARVPLADTTLVHVPAELDDGMAVLAADILPTAAFAAELAGVCDGGSLAIIGCGPVGLLAAFVARRRGVRALSVDINPDRSKLATRFGAREATDPEAAAAEGRAFDAVIDAAGTAAASRLAYSLVRPGGAVAAVAVNTDPHLAISPSELYDRNVTYRTGRCPARRYMEWALEVLEADDGTLASLVSHRLPLTEAIRAYRAFGSGKVGWRKVVLIP